MTIFLWLILAALQVLENKLSLNSAHPEMTNWPDIGVIRKILSSEYQPYASGKIFRKP
jgi:hypothetical protein